MGSLASKPMVHPLSKLDGSTRPRWLTHTLRAGFLSVALGAAAVGGSNQAFNELERKIGFANGTDLNEADAIVVLTGSNGRVEAGFRTVQPHQILYISGCNPKNDAKKILQANPQLVAQSQFNPASFHIDYAHDTRENALEIRNWLMRPENAAIDKIVIVTSDAHAPRAFKEMTKAFADFPREVNFTFKTVRGDLAHHVTERAALLYPF